MIKTASSIKKTSRLASGFTLLEIMVACLLLVIIAITTWRHIVSTRSVTRKAEIRLQTALMSNTVMQQYAFPQSEPGSLNVPSSTVDGLMNFSSDIVYTEKTDLVEGHTFRYILMDCTTRSVEYPEISVVHQTIVRKVP